MGSKTSTILQLFFQQKILLTKNGKYDQMLERRVDLHMLKYVWFNFQADRLNMA